MQAVAALEELRQQQPGPSLQPAAAPVQPAAGRQDGPLSSGAAPSAPRPVPADPRLPPPLPVTQAQAPPGEEGGQEPPAQAAAAQGNQPLVPEAPKAGAVRTARSRSKRGTAQEGPSGASEAGPSSLAAAALDALAQVASTQGTASSAKEADAEAAVAKPKERQHASTALSAYAVSRNTVLGANGAGRWVPRAGGCGIHAFLRLECANVPSRCHAFGTLLPT